MKTILFYILVMKNGEKVVSLRIMNLNLNSVISADKIFAKKCSKIKLFYVIIWQLKIESC
jgi:hypothetical protein